jgi:tRNA modification GTPase
MSTSAELETIYAPATPAGRSGVAVLRVSGARAFESLKMLTGAADFAHGDMVLKRLKNPQTSVLIDHTLVVKFENPRSYTGEDTVEYHLHGSPAIMTEMLEALSACESHRMALPGEFTRRAFENGKMDLTQAEAVADLIDAQTSLQKSQALSQMSGVLSTLYEDWTERVKKSLAHLEADIEFPDEDMDVSSSRTALQADSPLAGIAPVVITAITALQDEIAAHLDDNRRGERLRDGIQIAIIGAPNAGKSSLVNALAQRDVAIVSDMAGTTRDVVEAHLNLGGYPVIIADTAGLRPEELSDSAQDKIESEGIKRAITRAGAADLRILLFDGTQGNKDTATLDLKDEASLVVVNKADLSDQNSDEIAISAKTGQGLDDLTNAIIDRIQTHIVTQAQDAPSLTRARHRDALNEAQIALSRALNAPLPELVAEDLRLSARAIGRITGRIDVEDLLDVIFNDFCIGK